MLMRLGGDFQPLQNAMQYKLFLIRSRDGVFFSDDRSIDDILDEINYGLF